MLPFSGWLLNVAKTFCEVLLSWFHLKITVCVTLFRNSCNRIWPEWTGQLASDKISVTLILAFSKNFELLSGNMRVVVLKFQPYVCWWWYVVSVDGYGNVKPIALKLAIFYGLNTSFPCYFVTHHRSVTNSSTSTEPGAFLWSRKQGTG